LALDARTRAQLQAELQRLGDAGQKEAQSSPLVARERPLLHLAGYGALPIAYERLSFGPTAADEVVAAQLLQGNLALIDAPQVVVKIADLAARRVVRDGLVVYEAQGKWVPENLLRIANALHTLRRWDLLARALECLPNENIDGEIRHRLALAHAQAGNLQAARQVLSTPSTDTPPPLRAQAQMTLAAVQVLERGQTETLEQRLALARAELDLRRPERARKILEPLRDQAPLHLGLAVTVIEADLDAELCPGLPRGLGNGPLCAAAFRAAKRAEQIESLLSAAWQSGKGRDPRAIEAALGLRYVIPLAFRAPDDVADAAAARAQALTGLSAALRETATAPRSKALHAFAQVVERAALHSGKINAKERAAWRANVLSHYREAPAEPATAAAVLGMATWLGPTQEIGPLLDAIKVDTLSEPSALGIWVKLNAVTALASGDPARLEKSKSLLPQWLERNDSVESGHGELLLLLAQADAAFDPTNDRKWHTVAHVSGSTDLPVEARLQRVLALATEGQRVPALQLLEQLERVMKEGASSTVETRGLLVVSRILSFALRGLDSDVASERASRGKDLLALLKEDAAVAKAMPGIALWAEIWAQRLRLPDAQCPTLLCAKKILASRPALRRQFDVRTVQLMEHGVLSLGNVGLSWSYSFEKGLTPVIWVEPRWLLAP